VTAVVNGTEVDSNFVPDEFRRTPLTNERKRRLTLKFRNGMEGAFLVPNKVKPLKNVFNVVYVSNGGDFRNRGKK
jgi:hypothetical protein